MNYTDKELRDMIVSRRKRQRMRKVILRLAAILVVLLLIGFGVFSIVRKIKGPSQDKDNVVTYDGSEEDSGDSESGDSDGDTEEDSEKDSDEDIAETSAGGEEGELSNKLTVIYLDAGHGGMDGGAVSGDRLEKDDNLKLELAVRDELKSRGYIVTVSRSEDVDVEYAVRTAMGIVSKADVVVAFHRNVATEGEGVEAWIPSSNPGDSRYLAENILSALEKFDMYNRGAKVGTLADPSDNYYPNEVPGAATCLVEVGFMNDASDNALFDNRLDELAKAIADAIEKSV